MCCLNLTLTNYIDASTLSRLANQKLNFCLILLENVLDCWPPVQLNN